MKVNPNNDAKSRFNALLVEYINTFNLLEINLGLSISFIIDSDYEKALIKVSRQSFKEKIDYFCKYIEDSMVLDVNSELTELKLWSSKAYETKNHRNMYLHGHWAYFPHLEKCIELSIPPWFKPQTKKIYKQRMSIGEFQLIVEEIKGSFQALMSIREKQGI